MYHSVCIWGVSQLLLSVRANYHAVVIYGTIFSIGVKIGMLVNEGVRGVKNTNTLSERDSISSWLSTSSSYSRSLSFKGMIQTGCHHRCYLNTFVIV